LYKIVVDANSKIIYITIAGQTTTDEVRAGTMEINDLLLQFEAKEFSILISAERLDPISQDSIPLIQESMKFVIERANKIAAVHKRVITMMQMRRIEKKTFNNEGLRDRIARFNSAKEALAYIKE